MTTECTFCTGTGVDPDGARCTWCDATGRTNGLYVKGLCACNQGRDPCTCKGVTRYNTVQLRFATGDVAKAEYVDARMFDELKADRDSLKTELEQCQARRRQFVEEVNTKLTVLDERTEALEARKASLHHVGMELMGVIEEYRAMPCDSLMRRMFETSKRYAPRLLCKCQECYDKGYVMVESGNEANPFTKAPCPACSTKP